MQIPTTHVGSLPRPAEMVTRELRKEEISSDELEEYVKEIVGRQLDIGLSAVNNGELPRADYVDATIQRILGFGGTGLAPFPMDLEALPEYSRRFSGRNGLITLNPKAPIRLPACDSELEYRGEHALKEELAMLVRTFEPHRTTYPGAQLFFTAPSPGTVALFMKNSYYPTRTAYLEKLGEILQNEYETIEGYDVQLQVDCPDIAMGRHTTYKALDNKDFIDLIEENVAVLNTSLVNIPPERCRAHVCWGNYPGSHHCDIELEAIFPTISKLHPQFISIESCNHRHAHEWRVFEGNSFPHDKILMPGVIDTNTNIVEHPDLISNRLKRFVSILGPDRVVASTDCGFASTAGAASVSSEVAWLKLRALVEGARRASEKV